MRRLVVGLLVLALSIAVPATFEGTRFLLTLWAIIGVAALVLVAIAEPVRRRFPWTFYPRAVDEPLRKIVWRDMLRRDLQAQLHVLFELTNPTVSELREFAAGVAERLEDEGHKAAARRFQVHLPDNAPTSDVKARRDELHTLLMRMLLWDNYS